MQIIMHGLLSHKFEKIIEVDQSIEKDLLIDFIGSRHKNFKIFLKKSANQGNFYEIIESNKIFHFVPVITGTIGAAAMAAIGSMAGKFIAGAVTNIAIGGLLQLISPAEEEGFDGAEDVVVLQSTRFQGLQNVASEGDKVPIGYGRLKIGSHIINQYSENINTSKKNNISEIDGPLSEEDYVSPSVEEIRSEYMNVTDYQDYYESRVEDIYETQYDTQSLLYGDDSVVEVSTGYDDSLLPPSATDVTQLRGTVGQPFTYTVVAPDSSTVFSHELQLPEIGGLTLNSSTGVISGVPVNPGSFLIHIIATTSVGSSIIEFIVIEVFPSIILSPASINAVRGQFFSYQIETAFESITDVTFGNTALPSGLSRTGDIVSGTLSTAGTFTFTVSAEKLGESVETLEVTVISHDLITMQDQFLRVGQRVDLNPLKITTFNDQGDTFSIDAPNVSQALPLGISLLSNGLFSGIPEREEIVDVPVVVSRQAAPAIASQTKTITFNIVSDATPEMTSSSEVTLGAPPYNAISFTLTADNNPTLFEAVGLDLIPGLSLDAVSGVISGTPETPLPIDINIAVRARNSFGLGPFQTVRFLGVDNLPIVGEEQTTDSGVKSYFVGPTFGYELVLGTTLSIQFTATNSPTRWRISNLISGDVELVDINNDGLATFEASAYRPGQFMVFARNGSGEGPGAIFTIKVRGNIITGSTAVPDPTDGYNTT